MSPLARRGRLILWVLLAILLLDEWGSYVIAISRKGFGDVGFRNHAMVLLVSYFAFDLARNGELLGRFLLAVVASVRAYLNFRLAFVLWRGAEALHQDNAIKQAGMTREGVMLMVSSLGAAGLVKVFAVLALFFVPPIRVFLAYQKMKTRLRYEPTPSNVIVALSKHNRPRDDELTFDLLRALDPAKRYDFISEYVYCLDDQELEQAPPALRMVSAVNELATYVGSGGFHNYYSTTGGCRIEMAVAGLELLQQSQHRDLLLKTTEAIDASEQNPTGDAPRDLPSLVEKHLETIGETQFPQFDDCFNELPNLFGVMDDYINSHLSEFVHCRNG